MPIRPLPAVLLALGALAVACGEDGKDVGGACPELPLYDIGTYLRDDEPNYKGKRGAISQANREGCTTPIGEALTNPNERRRSTGGSGGSGRTGGSGGSGGGAPDAGSADGG